MALRRVHPVYVLTNADIAAVRNIAPTVRYPWELNRNALKALRQAIRAHLENIQNFHCCYCGLPLGETSPGEIDHVAPSAQYPQFSYEVQNLVLACDYCNGFSKKGQADTIVPALNGTYNLNNFTIVHPVLDHPLDQHIRVRNCVVQGLTPKGLESIRMFDLDNERQFNARKKNDNRSRVDRLTDTFKELYEKFFGE